MNVFATSSVKRQKANSMPEGKQDLDRLLADVVVLVNLQLLDLVETLGFFDVVSVLVAATGGSSVRFADLEDVPETLEGDVDYSGIAGLEKIAERLNAALSNEVADLLGRTAADGVRNGPGSLLLDVEFSVTQKIDEGRDDVGIDDDLNVGLGAGGNVGDGPASLLRDSLLGAVEERQEAREGGQVDDDLNLKLVAGNDVADSPEGGGQDAVRGVPAKRKRNA